MKKILHLLVVSFFFASCQKQPTASFTTDKETYQAGETIHFTDASTNAKHWNWTLPDGSTSSNRNLDFVIDSNTTIGGNYSITLQTTSNNFKKKSNYSKPLKISQKVFYNDFITLDNGFSQSNIKINEKYPETGSDNWKIIIGRTNSKTSYGLVYITFDKKPNTNQLYNLQFQSTSLAANQANIFFGSWDGHEMSDHKSSIRGSLFTQITPNGKLDIIFNNIKSSELGDTTISILISGHISIL